MRWSFVLWVLLAGCQRPCDASTCGGCCASLAECVDGTARLECGVGGAICQRCRNGERCNAGKCETLPDAGPRDAGPQSCNCQTACCLPDGSCSPNNGIDACGPAYTFCGRCEVDQRCEQGQCVAGACRGCLDPLGACRTGQEDQSCGADGGVCLTCGTDQACQAGRCVFIRCDITTCRFGCCQMDKSCVTTPGVQACGLGGNLCVACLANQQCVGGAACE